MVCYKLKTVYCPTSTATDLVHITVSVRTHTNTRGKLYIEYAAHSSNCTLRNILVTTLADYGLFAVSSNKLSVLHLSSTFVKKTSHLNQW